jgi:hypothetical protein
MSLVDCQESEVRGRVVELECEELHHKDDALEFRRVNREAHMDTLLYKAYVQVHQVPSSVDVVFHLAHSMNVVVPKLPDVLVKVVDFPFVASLHFPCSDEVVNGEAVMRFGVAEDLRAAL